MNTIGTIISIWTLIGIFVCVFVITELATTAKDLNWNNVKKFVIFLGPVFWILAIICIALSPVFCYIGDRFNQLIEYLTED